MGIIFIGFLVVLIVPATVAYFISSGVKTRLTNAGNKRVRLLTILTFIGCFLLILSTILYGLSFIRLER